MISRTNGKQRISDTRALATAITLLAVGGVLLATTACSYGNRDGPKVDAWLEIKGRRVSVEIADTPRQQQKGLGGREAWFNWLRRARKLGSPTLRER